MALLQCNIRSAALGKAVGVNVILNQNALTARPPGYRSPVLYLLHGLSGDHSSWVRRSSIERYAEAYDVAVVMPAADRSFYTNMASGYRYWDFVADELPALCQRFFPVAADRERVFVAGLSMGGYGAFKLALTRPEQFGAAASLSGALDLLHSMKDQDQRLPEWRLIFGDEDAFAGSPHDLLHLASVVARSESPRPALYQRCGQQDFLFPMNRSFRDHCLRIGLALDYDEGPGDHDWRYWDLQIQQVLQWLPLQPAVPEPAV